MASSDTPPRIVTELPRLPARKPEMHKGQVGRVAIVAGSRGMSGAACLSAIGALRSGAGLVRVYSPECVQPIVAASEPCLMTVALEDDTRGLIAAVPALDRLRADLEWPNVLAIGPGLGQDGALAPLVTGVLEMFADPMVIDADGLNNLTLTESGTPWWQARSGRATVITPHPGEMLRLCRHAGLQVTLESNDQSRLNVAHEYAQLTGLTVVLKGHRTVVCTPDRAYFNTTGNPGMATGGMGDVLTGLIASLLGQGLPAFEAACLGVHMHGLAADRLARQIGPVGYLAREVADLLPAAMAQVSRAPMGFK
ncbi:MAG: NAD(P)H-hydrate dehydratase [Planctomycetota bacterium]